ncbi:MAG: malto-oligosyltrehalose trehalohydrolase [Gemmatimonadota bacterium]|nr:MAG: malto-oligosyltrehalose trehalohydrolase [Gemmatimonadota bacterium]
MSQGWTLERGATVLPDGSSRFSVWAPAAGRVAVRILKPDAPFEVRMESQQGGVLEAFVPDLPPGTEYYYRLDDARDRPDPVSRYQPAGVHGPSRLVDPRAFRWSDSSWRGLDRADLVIYELHVATFSPAGTFAGAADRLSHLRELGVTAIELMPVAQFPGMRNWGYDGAYPYAPQNSYGGPDGLRHLVDAAHGEGIAVLLDVVYNHLGPEGNYLSEFGPYFTDRYGTPWGQAVNFDGPESDEVRRYFIENALYWVTEYHIDGLRLDAVHAIFDFGARHILEELAAAVHAVADSLGRRVHVIAESDLNDPRLVRDSERGGFALDAAWSDDFHHAVHSTLTGERNGYYVDFNGSREIAKAVSDRYVLDGSYSVYRRRRHGAPAVDVPADRFVVFTQNHDQVGNRAQGERLSQLVPFEQQKLAASLLLLSPYIPLLFMGQEYGETNPFLYFVDHGDSELVAAVREGRAREFERFAWSVPIPDPAAPETLERSRLNPENSRRPPHSQILGLYKDLLKLRRERPALRPGAAAFRVESDPESRWFAIVFQLEHGDTLALFNLSDSRLPISLQLPRGDWRRELASDEVKYGGVGTAAPSSFQSDGVGIVILELSGHSAAAYSREYR